MTIRAWWSRLRGTLDRRDADGREMEREMAFHLEMSAKRNMDRGMSPDLAARQAKVAFGSVGAAMEEAHEAQRAMVLENAILDLRFALRSLRRAPSFALATTLTMALGIAASTAIFSVLDAVLLRPLAIPEPEDFVYVGWVWEKGGDIPALTSFQYDFVRGQNRSFAAFAAFSPQEGRLGTAGGVVPLRGLRVSGEFFRTIGFSPVMGRAFDSTELTSDDAPVVILSDATWRARFGGDPGIVGRRILLDENPRTVVGVMPANFRFPPAADHDGFLVPFAVHPNASDEGHNTDAIARLRHGTADEARDADVRALSQRFAAAYPALASPHERFKLYDHRDVSVGPLRRTLWLIFGAVSLLLLIACANTATLLLVRASVRQREIAVRASLGAGPARIIQQLLTEGFVLAGLSSALGLLAGVLAVRGFLAVAPAVLPVGMDPQLDGRVLAYAVGLSTITGIVFGLATAMPSLRMRLHSGVLSGARGASSGGTRAREMLVFLETASAVILLAGATTLTASFARLMSVDVGFESDRVVAVRLGRFPSDYTAERRDQVVDRLLERVRAIPGVEQAAVAPNLPLERGRNFPVDTREHPDRAIGATEIRPVSPGYFATLGVPLVAGRDISADDARGGEPVAIVNQTLARRFWGNESPIGRTIQIGHFKDWLSPGLSRQTRVIGVSRDIHEVGLDRPPRPTVVVPQRQFDHATSVLLVRGSAPELGAVLRREVLAEDPQLAPTIESLTSVVNRSVAGPRFRTVLIATFAGSALLLAAIGIYGVIAAIVEQRRREIGIRLSLGATRAAVTVTVVRRCLAWVSAGAVAGIFGFWSVRQSLTSMLYETSTGDPRVLAAVMAILAIVATLAAWIPARRAAQVDPAITLRLD